MEAQLPVEWYELHTSQSRARATSGSIREALRMQKVVPSQLAPRMTPRHPADIVVEDDADNQPS